MRVGPMESQLSYRDEEVDLGDGIFADLRYEVVFRVSGEDPSLAFDVDIIELSSLEVIQAFDEDGHRITVTGEIETAARRAFYRSRQSRLESILYDQIVEGDL